MSFGEPPNVLVREEMAALTSELPRHLEEFNQFAKSDVAPYNQEAYNSGAPTLYAGEPLAVKEAAGI